MTKPTLQKNEGRRVLCCAMFGSMIFSITSRAHAKKGIPMSGTTINSLSMSLWQIIARLTQEIPFSKQGVQSALGLPLVETQERSTEFFQFYNSNELRLQGDLRIKADLRISRQDNHPGFLVLNVQGSCIRLSEVNSRYGNLSITDHPRGRSPDEVTSHTTNLTWGALSFSFKESCPDCLSSVAFEPKKS